MADNQTEGKSVRKLHRNLAEAVWELLIEVFERQQLAERILDRRLQAEKKWGARDRRWVAESFFELVRWRRKWSYLAGKNDDVRGEDWWAVLGTYWQAMGYARPAWALWPERADDEKSQLQRLAQAPRAIRESLPDELDAYGEAQLGTIWSPLLTALNQPAEIYLRRRLGRESEADFLQAAQAEKIELERVQPAWANFSAWRVIDRHPVPARFLARGLAEIQDLGSQAIAPFLEVEPGQTVIDACAGAGGKTLHLADLMNHRGSLLALDVVPAKLKTLEARAQRAGAAVQTQLWSAELTQRLKNHADRLLVDAPCSGSGTWRRQPDLKWRTTPTTVQEQVQRQREILIQAADWVRPGGKLVYATCSVFPAENADQVAWFLAQREDFVFEESRQLWPHEHGTDGFFMARWQRR